MPYTIKTKDGIVVDGIPDEIANDDQSLKDLVAQLRASGEKSATYSGAPSKADLAAAQGGPTQQETGSLPQQSGPPLPFGQDLGNNAGAAARGVVGGLASPVTVVADPLTHLLNLILPDQYKQLPPSEGLQALLTSVGVPDAQTEAQRILGAAAGGMAGGAANVGLGTALKTLPGTAGRVGAVMAEQPGAQITGGAAGGVSAEGARALGAPTIVQLAAGMAGGAVGGKTGNTTVNPADRSLVDLGKQAGVRVMTSDVFPPKGGIGKFIQGLGEFLGTGKTRQIQGLERAEAIRKTAQEYGADTLQGTEVAAMSDLLAKHDADLTKWVGQKHDVLDKLSSDLTNDATIAKQKAAAEPYIQAYYIERQNRINRPEDVRLDDPLDPVYGNPKALLDEQTALYSKIKKAQAEVQPSLQVPMTNVNKAIDAAIAHLQSLSNGTSGFKSEIDALNEWKQMLQGQTINNVDDLRAWIGDKLASFKANPTDPKTVAEKDLATIYGQKNDNGVPISGLQKDMYDYIKANGTEADLNKWMVANKELTDMIGQVKLGALKLSIDKGEVTPERIKSLIFSSDKSTVEALYKNLSPAGQVSVKAALLSKAIYDDRTLQPVAPNEFVTRYQKLAQQTGVFFSEKDKQAIGGLTKLMEATSRAEAKPMAAPSNIRGMLTLPAVGYGIMQSLGGGMQGILAAVAGGVVLGGASKVIESKVMRDLLIQLNRVKPGSDQEQAVLKGLMTAAESAMQPKTGPKISTGSPGEYGSQNYSGAPGAPTGVRGVAH